MAASRKIKTIAWRLVRELERLLPAEVVQNQLFFFKQTLFKKKKDKKQNLFLHEPEVCCKAKGKNINPMNLVPKFLLVLRVQLM